jgi:hypothetical protein
MRTTAKVNDGVFFVGDDHPVCKECVTSLDRDEDCHTCGGDGFIDSDDFDMDDEGLPFVECHECRGIPAGWVCVTCWRRWPFSAIRLPEDQ